jgi:hypothetical protein
MAFRQINFTEVTATGSDSMFQGWAAVHTQCGATYRSEVPTYRIVSMW